MFRTATASLAGLVAGVLLFVLLLGCAVGFVRLLLEPSLAVEHQIIYLSVLLGAGFGAVAGALVGLAGAARPPAAPPAPQSPARTTQSTS